MYNNGIEQGPMYGNQSGQAGLVGKMAERESASNLLARQIEDISMQVSEVMKMSSEVRDRLLGSEPQQNSNAPATSGPASCGGVLGTASGRLHTVRMGLEEAKRALSRVLTEV